MAIKLTKKAVEKAKEFRDGFAREKNIPAETVFLRMGVKGGGCSGLSYTLEFGTEKGAHDKVFGREVREDNTEFVWGVEVVIEVASYLYLNGTVLDYVTEGLSGGFTFKNPKAKSSCGCGTSFTPDE